MKNFPQGAGELIAEVRAAANEEAGDFAFGIDDNCLRNGGDSVFFRGRAVLIENDIGLEIQPFEQALDGFGIFLHVDGDELDVIGFKIVHCLIDLGHGGDAGAAPSSEKVENDDVALVVAEFEFAAVEGFQGEIGSGLADQGAVGAGGVVGGIIGA